MRRRWILMLALVVLSAGAAVALAGCSSPNDDNLSDFFEAADGAPAPSTSEQAQSAQASEEEDALLDLSIAPTTALEAVNKFFALIRAERYEDAYRLVSLEARERITAEEFAQRYQDIGDEATIRGLSYEIMTPPGENVLGIDVILRYDTAFFGQIEERIFAPTRRQPNWTVDWSPSLIFDGLAPRGYLIHRFIDAPDRGSIFDRNGVPLAIEGAVAVIGISHDLIDDVDEVIDLLLDTRLGLDERQLRTLVFQDVPSYFFIPIVRLPYDADPGLIAEFDALADKGILVQQETRRSYPQRSLAAHLVGFLGEVTEEDLETLAVEGYAPGDLVGADGAEAIFERVLAGRRGGRLTIIGPDGQVVHEIASRPMELGLDVYLTIDVRVQRLAEVTLGEQAGAVIALDLRSNELLAVASYPRFDPNLFVPPRSDAMIAPYLEDEAELQPFVNRPAERLYPPGSTFKIVTLAAALEVAGYDGTTRLDCPAVWTGLGPEAPLNNWKEKDQGLLTLTQALAESCNPVFYQLGLSLHNEDEDALAQFATGFGFGQRTGVVGMDELAGISPGPDWKRINRNDFWYTGDTVNMSIGQGFLLATPLQITNAYAALAADGILRTPLAVHSLRSADGEIIERFQPQPIGVLPVSADTLGFLRNATRQVIVSRAGTGWVPFNGSSLLAAGKSGTAEDLGEQNHALFVAYANIPDARLVVTAVLDDGESGADDAGPIVRTLLERTLLGGLLP